MKNKNCNYVLIFLHVHTLLGNELANEFPRRQIFGKQSVAKLRNNIGGCSLYRPRQATVGQRGYAIRF
jgi:hypothetical protein